MLQDTPILGKERQAPLHKGCGGHGECAEVYWGPQQDILWLEEAQVTPRRDSWAGKGHRDAPSGPVPLED